MTDDPVVQVPAELELEDRLAGPVTFRMAGWLAAGGAGVALLVLCWDQAWAIAVGSVLLPVGLVGALWQPGGRPLTAWCSPLLSYRRRLRAGPGPGSEAGWTPTVPADCQTAKGGGGDDVPLDEHAPDNRQIRCWRRRGVVTAAAVLLLVGLAVGGWPLLKQPGSPSPALPVPAVSPRTAPDVSPVAPVPADAPPTVVRLPRLWWVDPLVPSWGDELVWWWLDCDC